MTDNKRPASREQDDDDNVCWHADADVVPDWRLRLEIRAIEIGILELPHYRTGAEFAAAVALCEATVAIEPDPPTTVVVTVSPMLAPAAAAADFANWLIVNRHWGTHTSKQLAELYDTHCQQANRLPTPENKMREHLGGGKQRGIHKKQCEGRRNGKRARLASWIISETVSMRKAA